MNSTSKNKFITQFHLEVVFMPYTVFDLITAHTPKAHSQAVPLSSDYSQCTFCLLFCKGICCGYSFELH